MKILIEIDTENAAFEDDPNELSRVFCTAFHCVLEGLDDEDDSRISRLLDINGNTVGKAKVSR